MRPDTRDDPDRPEGRRRASRRVLAWAPGLTDQVDHSEPLTVEPLPSEPETFGGIGIGDTPVSVTPPSSWRKAAWFIVAASSVVLVVLVFAAVRLADPERRFHIDAFPGLPTGGLLTPQQPPTGSLSEPSALEAEGNRPDSTQPRVETSGGSATAPATPGPGPTGAAPPGQGDGGQSDRPLSETAPSPSQPPAIEIDELLDVTRLFFEVLPENMDAALELMSPRVRVQGHDDFDKHWKKFKEVRLKHVIGVEDSAVTVDVDVKGHNGRSATQRYKLIYQRGNPWVIDDAVLLDDGGFDNGGNKPFK